MTKWLLTTALAWLILMLLIFQPGQVFPPN
jgi:hypothetical protein